MLKNKSHCGHKNVSIAAKGTVRRKMPIFEDATFRPALTKKIQAQLELPHHTYFLRGPI